jgi:hypothetical protein
MRKHHAFPNNLLELLPQRPFPKTMIVHLFAGGIVSSILANLIFDTLKR